MKKSTLALAVIGAAILGVGGFTWSQVTQPGNGAAPVPPPPPQVEQAAGQSQDPLLAQRTKGSSDAPITIYEIGDFQCPACRMFFTSTLPHLMREYIETGKAKLIYINFPIVELHPNAAAAHEFAMCAARQDRFWPVHDLLYGHQSTWERMDDPGSYFKLLADSAHLDGGKLNTCLNSGSTRWLVAADFQMSAKAGIRSTPSFVVEGGLLAGAAPIESWRPLLDSIYTAKTGTR